MALFGLGGGTTSRPTPPPDEVEPIEVDSPSPPSPPSNLPGGNEPLSSQLNMEIAAASGGAFEPQFSNQPAGSVGLQVGSPTSDPSSGGGGGGGVPTTSPSPGPGPGPGSGLVWEETFEVEGAPEWWRGMTPSELTPTTEVATLINNMIPFMSPEDQRTAGQNLARMFGEPFGRYDPQIQDFPVPPEVGPGTEFRERFESEDRAARAVTALSDMAQSINRTPDDFGPGFQFLQQLLDVERDFGGGGDFIRDEQQPQEFQTRAERRSERAALDPLLAETEGRALQAFGPLARMLTDPFFSAGDLSPSVETRAGNRIPGVPNPRLFT